MTSKRSIYLDHAAATQLDPQVLEAMRPWQEEQFYNPSSLYAAAREARAAVEDARWRVAQILGAKKTEIIFTAGATESINLVFFGTLRALALQDLVLARHARPGLEPVKVIASSIEHESVLASLEALKTEGYDTELVAVERDGIIKVEEIAKAIDNQTVLVSIMYANNEIGTIQPIARVAKLVDTVRQDRQKRGIDTPLYLHTDAAQAAGFLDLHVSRLGVDLMSLNGSKIYGPKQTGCLYVRTGTHIQPIIHGGGQERGLRSGTENVAGIIGFAKALELMQETKTAESYRLTQLRNGCLKRLNGVIPNLVLNGHAKKRLPNNLNISVPGIDGEKAVLYLDQAGIQASTGSACSTGRVDPSHVLLAIGCSAEKARGSLRFSLGKSTVPSDIDQLIQVLPVVLGRVREIS